MSLAVPVVTLTTLNPIQVEFGKTAAPRRVTAVIVENPTPYALQILAAGNGLYLPAFVGDMLPLMSTGGYTLNIVPQTNVGFIPGAQNQIYITVLLDTDDMPSGYPIALQNIVPRIPNLMSTPFNVTVANTAGAVLVPGVPGKIITLYTVQFEPDAASAASGVHDLSDGTTQLIHFQSLSAAPRFLQFPGLNLTAGNDLRVVNGSGAQRQYVGGVTFTQG